MKRPSSAMEHGESTELTKLKRTAEAHLDKFRSGTQKGLAALKKTLHSLEEAAQGTANLGSFHMLHIVRTNIRPAAGSVPECGHDASFP